MKPIELLPYSAVHTDMGGVTHQFSIPTDRTPQVRVSEQSTSEKDARVDFIFKMLQTVNAENVGLETERLLQIYGEEQLNHMLQADGLAFDIDHTISHDPRLLVTKINKSGTSERTYEVDDSLLPEEEKENYMMLAALALSGKHVSLLTGRDIMAFPSALYVQQLLYEFIDEHNSLKKQGDLRAIYNFSFVPTSDNEHYYRPTTIDGTTPALVILGTCNGAQLFDVLDNFKIIKHHTIEDEFWLSLAENPEIVSMIQQSMDPKRLNQMDSAFSLSDDRDEIEQQLDDVSKAILTLRRAGANVSYNQSKVNFVFNIHNIVNGDKDEFGHTELQRLWQWHTGVLITEDNKISMKDAFINLMHNLYGGKISIAGAVSNGQRVIDVNPLDINKGSALREIQTYAEMLYNCFGRTNLTGVVLTNGDNHGVGENDYQLLYKVKGSVSCSGDPKKGSPVGAEYPLLLRILYGDIDWTGEEEEREERKKLSVTYTNRYLRDILSAVGVSHSAASQLN